MRQVQERWRVRVYILGSQYTTSTSLTSPHCLPTHTHDCHHLCVTWYTCTRGPHLRVLRPHTHTPTCVSCAPPPAPPHTHLCITWYWLSLQGGHRPVLLPHH